MSKESSTDQHTGARMTQTIIQTMPIITGFASRLFLQGPTGLCTEKLSAEEAAEIKRSIAEPHNGLVIDYEPVRTSDLCNSKTPPRRFYLTSWRSIACRLKKLVSIKRKEAELLAYQTKSATNVYMGPADAKSECT